MPTRSSLDSAMAEVAAATKATQKRNKQSFALIQQLLSQPNYGGGGSGIASPVGRSASGFGGEHSGGSSSGYSTGAIPPLVSYNWRGMPLTTAKGTKKDFRGLLNDLAAEGYKINSLGSYANRNARGSNRLSEHAYGRAIDINPGANPMGPNLVTNMPKNVAELARLHHLIWGGTWRSKKDPMHFSTTGY